jgi:lipopolysaccharide transport system ATP-binding protein
MSNVAIHVESLGKRYRIGARAQYHTMRDRLTHAWTAPSRWFRPGNSAASGADRTHFWALRNVSFEMKEGEVLGLIGRNGAGKTTLLKILSRVTQPTEGSAEIRGRVGSLLEVGTGFHPELSGRENTYLNGAILGMGKKEIDRKFDDIVAFAEVADFIDTPLKHYSTGMQMRLAFAVAAHFEPQILFVDEVLAVGDIAFQKKCLGKMGEVAKAGRTIVLVTHQMNQIRRLCPKVIWIDGGTIRDYGLANSVINAYEADIRLYGGGNDAKRDAGRAKFLRWEIEGRMNGGELNVLDWDGEVRLKFIVNVSQPLRNIHHGIALYGPSREVVWGNAMEGLNFEPGTYELVSTFPSLPLQPGIYNWRASFYENGEAVDDWDCSPPMSVELPPRTHRQDKFMGVLNIPSKFENTRLSPGLEKQSHG